MVRPTQTTGAEFERLIEAIIQLAPLAGIGEFFDACTVEWIRRCGEQREDVGMAIGTQFFYLRRRRKG